MPFVPRRVERYEHLRKAGFTDFEARTLSHIASDTPYLQRMTANRAREFSSFKAKNRGLTTKQINKTWKNEIIHTYKEKNFWKGLNESSVWEFFRENRFGEHAYKRTDREYISPWVDRQKGFRKSVTAIEKALNN